MHIPAVDNPLHLPTGHHSAFNTLDDTALAQHPCLCSAELRWLKRTQAPLIASKQPLACDIIHRCCPVSLLEKDTRPYATWPPFLLPGHSCRMVLQLQCAAQAGQPDLTLKNISPVPTGTDRSLSHCLQTTVTLAAWMQQYQPAALAGMYFSTETLTMPKDCCISVLRL
jgi:hypothetical protein